MTQSCGACGWGGAIRSTLAVVTALTAFASPCSSVASSAERQSFDRHVLTVCAIAWSMTEHGNTVLHAAGRVTGTVPVYVDPAAGAKFAVENLRFSIPGSYYDLALSRKVDTVRGRVTSFRIGASGSVPAVFEAAAAPLGFGPFRIGPSDRPDLTIAGNAVPLTAGPFLVVPGQATPVRVTFDRLQFEITGTSSMDPTVVEHVRFDCDGEDDQYDRRLLQTIPLVGKSSSGVGIASVAPSGGPISGGTIVTIVGPGVGAATLVRFGGQAAASIDRISASEIRAASPASGPGTVGISVTTPHGTTPDTDHGDFTYRAPKVTELSPAFGRGMGGTLVEIGGTDLDAVTGVNFGEKAATSFYKRSPTLIRAQAPAGSGTVDVRLLSSAGASENTPADDYTYTVGTLSPQLGNVAGGEIVTVSGLDLSNAIGVRFGSLDGTRFKKLSPTSVQVTAPRIDRSVAVVVLFSDGFPPPVLVGELFEAMVVDGDPQISRIAPASGPRAGGTLVTIFGSNLNYAYDVRFGSVPAKNVKLISAYEMEVTAPPSPVAGKVDIRMSGGFTGGGSRNTPADDFTYIDRRP